MHCRSPFNALCCPPYLPGIQEGCHLVWAAILACRAGFAPRYPSHDWILLLFSSSTPGCVIMPSSANSAPRQTEPSASLHAVLARGHACDSTLTNDALHAHVAAQLHVALHERFMLALNTS